MKRASVLRYPVVAVLTQLVLLVVCAPSLAGGDAPVLNHGRKWRIGYYEGGPFSDYTDTMRTLIDGLIERGWIAGRPPVLSGDIARPYWGWLGGCDSAYLVFDAQDGYSAGWDDHTRSQNRGAMLAKLSAGRLDLVLAMGTWAGQDLAVGAHRVPTMVLSTSDPVRAGIVKSAADSGLDHVTARVDPNRYLRQIRMFHRLVGFDTLGVAYEDTPEGRIYAAMPDLEHCASERGFELVTCEVLDSIGDAGAADRSCRRCFGELAGRADAVYVTALTCIDRIAGEVADILNTAGVPSFAMVGSKFVREGLLLSISSDSGYAALGRYNAGKFAAILNGRKPRDLEQVFEDPLSIAVNRATARRIGFRVPKSILQIATEIYD